MGPSDGVRDRVGLCRRLGPRAGGVVARASISWTTGSTGGTRRRCGPAFWTIGVTLAAAGANVGQGPTEATTLGPMFLAVGGLLLLWAGFSVLTGSVAAVAVERDIPSGLRTAALLVALGLILGRSVAGDWISVESTLRDYLRQGLAPAAALLGVAAIIEFLVRPTVRRPATSMARAGLSPAALDLGFAAAWLWYLGPVL